jgi:hypothetical protein
MAKFIANRLDSSGSTSPTTLSLLGGHRQCSSTGTVAAATKPTTIPFLRKLLWDLFNCKFNQPFPDFDPIDF